MAEVDITQLKAVNAAPVKSFFVNMLTRDIPLYDAILDLLDNCIDGIVRSHIIKDDPLKPYEGYFAEIKFDGQSFSITDNCGGIPSNLLEYAFRLGRPDERSKDAKGSVGVYGIGMKRAIFKMGRQCDIITQNTDHRFKISIVPEWIDKNSDWDIPLSHEMRDDQGVNGTSIYISQLYENISTQMGEDALVFTAELTRLIQTHYAFIMEKGFKVVINGVMAEPVPTQILFNSENLDSSDESTSIRPYIYQTNIDGVDVFLTVGFTQGIPTSEELSEDQDETRYKSSDAGWTIICNDRAVVYRDRTELTGWGEAGVPSYHTQFIAIAGVVEFKSDDPAKLPTTTTKRGIDSSSRIYLQVKNKMREGMAIFTSYTNKWKGDPSSTKRHFSAAQPMTLTEIKTVSENISFTKTKGAIIPGEYFKPELPLPPKTTTHERRIAYTIPKDEFKIVSSFLLGEPDASSGDVGKASFKYALRKAR